MLILTNCLTDVADEGCLKVANSLIKRMKKADSSAYIITYDRQHTLSNKHLHLNKLLLNKELLRTVREKNDDILYVPFPAKTMATALRIFILSLFSKKKLSVVMVQRYHYNFIAKLLLKLSKAHLVVLSGDAFDFYGDFVDKRRISYLKAGVDTNKFVPVSDISKKELKEKYGFDADKKLILHCGHLNCGRGVDKLLDIDSKHQVLLVVSTLTKNEQEAELKAKLLARGNISIIEDYVANIEEIYQMSDVYFFPVTTLGKCIDVPLSCLEAASCNIPVVTTDFGEMKEFKGHDGFYFIDKIDKATIDYMIKKALDENKSPRVSVMPYDWDKSVEELSTII